MDAPDTPDPPGRQARTGHSHAGSSDQRCVRIASHGGVVTATILQPFVEAVRGIAIVSDIRDAISRMGPSLETLVLDMSYVDFVNSSGLGQFADLAVKVPDGVNCVLYGANEELSHVIRMVKLDRLYTLVSEPAELKKLVGGA